MPAEYWLDTNSYIDPSRRFYAFDIAPSYWTAIEDQARSGIVKSPRLVIDELLHNGTKPDGSRDELGEWVAARQELLAAEPTRSVQASFSEIADYVRATYQVVHVQTFLRGADPWVIAHARAEGGRVVTLEVREPAAKTIKRAKIPDVCDHFGIECLTPYEMLRRLKLSL